MLVWLSLGLYEATLCDLQKPGKFDKAIFHAKIVTSGGGTADSKDNPEMHGSVDRAKAMPRSKMS